MNATQLISVSKDDVARIIAQWWKEVEAEPEKFVNEPDTTGERSGDIFFRIAVDLGIALPLVIGRPACACCSLGCDQIAQWEIQIAPFGPDDNTLACTGHVGDLLTDSPEHRIYPFDGASAGNAITTRSSSYQA